jgi:hypothetical protein
VNTYAVYAVIVEDTEEDDQLVLTSGPSEEGERIVGDLSLEEAESLVSDLGKRGRAPDVTADSCSLVGE